MTIFDALEQPTRKVPAAKLSFGFVLAPDFTMIALAGFLAVLRQASDIGDKSQQVRCAWTIMGPNREAVTASNGLQILPWEVFRSPRDFDYVIVVGGQLGEKRRYQRDLLDYLKQAANAAIPLIGLCTGSFYLAEAGLMNHRKCCVHWYHFQDFIEEFPDAIPVTDEIFIDDGDRITCPGGTSAIDLALHLVELNLGKERALKSVRHLLMDWIRPHNHPQMPFTMDYSAIVDPRIRKAVYLMEQSIGGDPVHLEDIAKTTNTSVRQLERLFNLHLGKSPLAYFREMRLKYAHWLLSNTDRAITEIAYECGFSDGSHFSRYYKKQFGDTPTAARKKG
ncbi:MAG: GlxA family transcriptional regulator [Desulfosarcinaceae bacterium]|nr:GlxA family transcriptional regulator [Desulfosarcinaceae bacterium]